MLSGRGHSMVRCPSLISAYAYLIGLRCHLNPCERHLVPAHQQWYHLDQQRHQWPAEARYCRPARAEAQCLRHFLPHQQLESPGVG